MAPSFFVSLFIAAGPTDGLNSALGRGGGPFGARLERGDHRQGPVAAAFETTPFGGCLRHTATKKRLRSRFCGVFSNSLGPPADRRRRIVRPCAQRAWVIRRWNSRAGIALPVSRGPGYRVSVGWFFEDDAESNRSICAHLHAIPVHLHVTSRSAHHDVIGLGFEQHRVPCTPTQVIDPRRSGTCPS